MPQRKARQPRRVRNIYPYVRCHVLRHTFEAVGAIPGIHLRPRYGTLVTWRCHHCGTIRLDVIGRLSGELHYRQYVHPDDYAHEQMTMAEWRVLLLNELDDRLLMEMEDDA
jgi:hypothetical protein